MTTEDKLVQLFEAGQYELMYELMLATDTKIDSDKIKLHKLIDKIVPDSITWYQSINIILFNGQTISISRNFIEYDLNIHIDGDPNELNKYFEAVYQLTELFGEPYRTSKLDLKVRMIKLTEQQVIEYIFHFLYLDDE